MSRRYRVLCGTPDENCTGSKLITDQKLGHTKCHMTHEEAFKCYVRYLMTVLGYKRVGTREFQEPNSGPILVLFKPSKYGARLKTGKPVRYMPDEKNQGLRGVII